MKKGDIAINTVVIAVIALFILVLVIGIVAGAIPTTFKSITSTQPSEEDVALVNCQTSCNLASTASDCDTWKSRFCDKHYDEIKGIQCFEKVTCEPPAKDCKCEKKSTT